MHTVTLYTDLYAPLATLRSATRRLTACLLQPSTLFRRSSPNAGDVTRLVQTAMRYPFVRQWLLVIASESPRVRRALLARAAHELQSQPGSRHTAAALQQLADPTLLKAVTDTLFRQAGLEPLSRAHSTASRARVRLTELAERLEAREDAVPLATKAE